MKKRRSDQGRTDELRAAEASGDVQQSLDEAYRELEMRVAGLEVPDAATSSLSSHEVIAAIRERMQMLWRMTREPEPPQLNYLREFERLYDLWRRSVTTPDDIIDYCEDRLQWLESRLASLGSDDGPMSDRSVFGPDIESEIAALRGEVRRQERVLSRRHRQADACVVASPPTVNNCDQRLVWRGTQTDVAKVIHDFIQEGIIEEHGVAEFGARHILLRDAEGNIHEIDRRSFAVALRQFRTPSGTAKEAGRSTTFSTALENVGKSNGSSLTRLVRCC